MIETARLILRPLGPEDAAAVLAILNDPDFIAHVADRGLRTEDDARTYIAEGPAASRARHGYAMDAVVERDGGAVVGLMGLIRRPYLDHPDLGYAFLPAARGRGLAREAAAAVVDDARGRLGLPRVLAMISPANVPSIRLAEGLGFGFRYLFIHSHDGRPTGLYALDLR